MKILYVEDDSINRMVVEKLLGAEFDIELASTVQEGLQKAAENDYQVFLLDINLGDPDKDGVDLMHDIKRAGKHRKAMFAAVTAYYGHGMKEKFLNAGFDHYFPKPIDFEALKRTIHDYAASVTAD